MEIRAQVAEVDDEKYIRAFMHNLIPISNNAISVGKNFTFQKYAISH